MFLRDRPAQLPRQSEVLKTYSANSRPPATAGYGAERVAQLYLAPAGQEATQRARRGFFKLRRGSSFSADFRQRRVRLAPLQRRQGLLPLRYRQRLLDRRQLVVRAIPMIAFAAGAATARSA